MVSPHRLLLGVATLLACATARATAEPTTLAADLKQPTAIAYAPGPAGGFRLLVAESGGLTEFTLLGDGVLSRRLIDVPTEAPVLGLAVYEKRIIVVAPDRGSLLSEEDAPKPLALSEEAIEAGAFTGPPSLSERWLFVPARDGLLRGRLSTGRVMGLRRMAPAVHAAAITPAGYLVTLEAAPDGGFALSYRDPDGPADSIASYPIAGFARPLALAVRPTDSSLFALSAGEQKTRLTRLEVAGVASLRGPVRAVATPIVAPRGVTAMTFDPDGRLYVITESGTLVRLEKTL